MSRQTSRPLCLHPTPSSAPSAATSTSAVNFSQARPARELTTLAISPCTCSDKRPAAPQQRLAASSATATPTVLHACTRSARRSTLCPKSSTPAVSPSAVSAPPHLRLICSYPLKSLAASRFAPPRSTSTFVHTPRLMPSASPFPHPIPPVTPYLTRCHLSTTSTLSLQLLSFLSHSPLPI